MNKEDREFVELVKKAIAARDTHFIIDDIQRLVSIIERQEQAIKTCKEQRDEAIMAGADDWNWSGFIKGCDLELERILDGELTQS